MKQFSVSVLTFLMAGCIATAFAVASAEDDKEADGFVSLIPEEGFAGWSTKNLDQYWTRKDGMIVGENADKKGSDLWTDKTYADYELIIEYKNDSKGEYYDSGVFLRGASHQVQIGISGSLRVDLTGCIYCPKDGNGSYPQQPREKVEQAHKNGEWNTLHIVTKGKQITSTLNGVQINDYAAVKYPEKGKVGLQLHGNAHMNISFRTVKIKELN